MIGESGSDEVLYRLPDASVCHCLRGEAEPLEGIGDLRGRSGFVMAPFHASSSAQVVLMPVASHDLVDLSRLPDVAHVAFAEENGRSDYERAFDRMQTWLADKGLEKVVLARRSDVDMARSIDAESLFAKACAMYPHQMIALVSTSLSGTWLMATPESLVERKEGKWTTMALAGTMSAPGPWSEKNKREHAIVADYIQGCLTGKCTAINRSVPHTVTAARLFHLRTDFEFRLNDGEDVVDVLADLFPTPAVCGMPKKLAMKAILADEGMDRRYYSGFCGLWNLSQNAEPDTALYVSLRCMEMYGKHLRLYAGGGLLKESVERQEWDETEKKMQTMKALL